MPQSVLLLHSPTSAGPDHWLTHLATTLSAEGHTVEVPQFPDPDTPDLDTWLTVLTEHLKLLPTGRRVVIAHAIGATLWLHHTARHPTPRVDAVLLAAPLGSTTHAPGFVPTPLDPVGVRTASPRTHLTIGENDAHLPLAEAITIATTLAIDLDVIPAGGTLDPRTGYGTWPALHQWVENPYIRLVGHIRTI